MHFVHLAFICMHCFIFYLTFMFLFFVCKNPKPHKKWRIQKVWSYIFEYKLLSLFPSQILVCAIAFSAQNSLFKIDNCRAFEKRKKKCEEIYRHKSTHVSRSSKSIDQLFMTNLKIYLQQSHIVFKISPTKIYVHT